MRAHTWNTQGVRNGLRGIHEQQRSGIRIVHDKRPSQSVQELQADQHHTLQGRVVGIEPIRGEDPGR